ncbi:MAG: hypothetical protein JOZ33_12665 [Acidobacteriaceae bacterium]|nr:hypothetical protein [Acidobacteriaceae bacterium]
MVGLLQQHDYDCFRAGAMHGLGKFTTVCRADCEIGADNYEIGFAPTENPEKIGTGNHRRIATAASHERLSQEMATHRVTVND